MDTKATDRRTTGNKQVDYRSWQQWADLDTQATNIDNTQALIGSKQADTVTQTSDRRNTGKKQPHTGSRQVDKGGHAHLL
jgi:hypothetical protein